MNDFVRGSEESVLKILNAFKENDEIERLILPKLPESIFVEYFLPYFKGEVTDPVAAADLRKNWITLARHPMGEVNIINDQGEIIFTTPSIAYTRMFDPTKSDINGSFKDLLLMTNQINVSNPIRAKQYLENNMATKFNAMRIKGHVLTKEEQRWLEIFKRYTVKDKNTPTNSNSVAKPATNNKLTDDDLEEVDE